MTVYRELADGTLVMMTLRSCRSRSGALLRQRALSTPRASTANSSSAERSARRKKRPPPRRRWPRRSRAAAARRSAQRGAHPTGHALPKQAPPRSVSCPARARAWSTRHRGKQRVVRCGERGTAPSPSRKAAAGGSTMRVYREAADGTLVLTTMEELQETAVKAARRRSAAEAAAGAQRLDSDFFDGRGTAGPAPLWQVPRLTSNSASPAPPTPLRADHLGRGERRGLCSGGGGSGGGASGGTRRSSRRGSSSNTSRCVMPHDQQQVKLLGDTGPGAAGTDALYDGTAPVSEEPMLSSRALRAQSSGGGAAAVAVAAVSLSMGGASKRRSSAVREGTGLDAGGLMAVYSEDSSGLVKFTTMEERQEELKREATRKAEAEVPTRRPGYDVTPAGARTSARSARLCQSGLCGRGDTGMRRAARCTRCSRPMRRVCMCGVHDYSIARRVRGRERT